MDFFRAQNIFHLCSFQFYKYLQFQNVILAGIVLEENATFLVLTMWLSKLPNRDVKMMAGDYLNLKMKLITMLCLLLLRKSSKVSLIPMFSFGLEYMTRPMKAHSPILVMTINHARKEFFFRNNVLKFFHCLFSKSVNFLSIFWKTVRSIV